MLETRDLCKRFGGLVATDHVSLSIREGELHAVIGPNGAGKTTLIAQLAGELKPDQGAILFDGRDVTRLPVHHRAAAGLARSFQITSVFPRFTALQNVALAVQAHAGHSFRFWRQASRDEALNGPARGALNLVGLGDRAGVRAELLSHGEQRQLEIAMALATGPRMLLLDEPMAGMGPAEGAQMVEMLRGLKRRYTILLIEHDMDAVFALADWITVLVHGAVIATGTPAEIRSDPEVRRAYLGEEAG
ncbi:ABC transporter ATP-binding protein [Skermanella rosea]|uniref:ABC transporter ATP-binding protein n=1 Tax=Skermanella rosea TaxID=1817965 RepID=UPI001931BA25|nr:ABC transporter ATP-binding protein [Skermanella rosea]UEM06108.1 ABC transporter ATP-binding protein [Skermanella rosea]